MAAGALPIGLTIYFIYDGVKNKPEGYVWALRFVAVLGAVMLFCVLCLPFLQLWALMRCMTD